VRTVSRGLKSADIQTIQLLFRRETESEAERGGGARSLLYPLHRHRTECDFYSAAAGSESPLCGKSRPFPTDGWQV